MDNFKFKFDYWYTSVGFVGGSRTGKSYATAKLAALTNMRNSILVAYPDQKQAFAPYSKDIRVAADDELNGQTVDNFIELRKNKKVWCQILDDVDLFVKRATDSTWLENVPIAAKGHWEQGCIWQSRRVLYLPKKLVQNTDYLVFTHNVDKYDYDYLAEYAGLDLDLYRKLPPPVHDPKDPKKLLSAHYLILHRESGMQKIFSRFG